MLLIVRSASAHNPAAATLDPNPVYLPVRYIPTCFLSISNTWKNNEMNVFPLFEDSVLVSIKMI